MRFILRRISACALAGAAVAAFAVSASRPAQALSSACPGITSYLSSSGKTKEARAAALKQILTALEAEAKAEKDPKRSTKLLESIAAVNQARADVDSSGEGTLLVRHAAKSLGCSTKAPATNRAGGGMGVSTPSAASPSAAQLDLSGNWQLHTTYTRPNAAAIYYDYDVVLAGPPAGPWVATETLRATNNPAWSGQIGNQNSYCSMVLLANRGVGLQCPSTNSDGSNGPPVTCPGTASGTGYAGQCPGGVFSWELRRP